MSALRGRIFQHSPIRQRLLTRSTPAIGLHWIIQPRSHPVSSRLLVPAVSRSVSNSGTNMSAPLATAQSLDHLVLTVADPDITIAFYAKYLGMSHTVFGTRDTQRHALTFGTQKINLHVSGKEFEPKAARVQPGSADLCFLIHEDVDEVCASLRRDGIEVLEGGGVVDRTGAQGPIKSVYVRDPDGNLIE